MMNFAVKFGYLASGIFLLVGMIGGVLKYRYMFSSPDHKAPMYIDIAHRSALMYSFATIVLAELLKYNPYTEIVQLISIGVPVFFFAVTIAQYIRLGLLNKRITQFAERNFITTWGMLFLIIGEVGGVMAILWGFITSQLLN